MAKNQQKLGEIVSDIEKICKSCDQTRVELESLTQKIASLKSGTHDLMDEAREKRRKVDAMTLKLESKGGKWDCEKARRVLR